MGGAVDGRPMIAAEDDRRPLQRAHRDGSGGHVPNREDIFNLYVNRQLVGDPLWEVEPV